jgi:EmrB/QacA subfamily drug resistance transporter
MSEEAVSARQPADASRSGIDATPVSRREVFIVYCGFMVIMALAALDQSIVATALPRIVSDLGGVTRLSWIVTAYVLASTSVMPLYGKLSDQYGRKPLTYVAVVIFLAGSASCGFAQSMNQLILFRAIQGIGAGGLVPLSQIIIADLVPPRERGRYQGTIGIVYALASVAGPAIGGFITEALSWHWIFFINLPIGAVAIVMIAVSLKRSNPTRHRNIDYLGAALLAAATTCFLLALTLGGSTFAWASPEILGLGLGTIALACLFLLQEMRAREPIMPLILFRNKVFVMGTLVLAMTFMAMQGTSIFFPLFFQVVLGVKASNSGLLTAPMLIGIVVSARANGRFVYVTGRYKPLQIAGLALSVVAFIFLVWGTATGKGIPGIEPALIAIGLGLGMVNPNMTVAVQNAVERDHLGSATASSAFFRSLGAVVGVAGSGAILSIRLKELLASTALPDSVDARQLLTGGIVQIQALPPDAYAAVVAIYRQALTASFSVGIAATTLALIVAILIPELPLSTKTATGAAMTKSFRR